MGSSYTSLVHLARPPVTRQAEGVLLPAPGIGFAVIVGLVVLAWFVLRLRASLRLWKLAGVSFVEVDRMDGTAFERFVATLLRSRGWSVRETGKTGDGGVDLLGVWQGITYAIECKRYGGKVGVGAIQEVVAGKALYGATASLVVTNALFTKAARELARVNWVLLVDREVLRTWLLKVKEAA